MGCCLSASTTRQLQPASDTSHVPPVTQQHNDALAPNISDGADPERMKKQQGNKEDEETLVISTIRATDVDTGLERIPAGFYTAVQHSGREWRTESKRVSVNDEVVEWGGPIPIPSDLSTTVCFVIRASFEYQPVLGNGEKMREFTTTVKELLHRSEKDLPFTFFANDEGVVPPCSSILVIVKQQKRENNDTSALGILDPYRVNTGLQRQLEDATNHGHAALSRFRKHGERQDLERSVEQFDRALKMCPLNDPHRAAAESNTAMAKFAHCLATNIDPSFGISIQSYQSALSTRPAGHPDRPSTLIQLATVYFARFEVGRVEVDATRAEEFLLEAMELSSPDSHENHAAISVLQLHSEHKLGPVQQGGQSSVEEQPTSGSKKEDPAVQLLRRFEQSGNPNDLQRAILLLNTSVQSTSTQDQRHTAGLANLGAALSYRFRQLGDINDLGQAIFMQSQAVNFTPGNSPDKSTRLNDLGSMFLTRFECAGQLNDLDQAISSFGEADKITYDGQPGKSQAGGQGNLCNPSFARLGDLKELRDLELAISKQKDNVQLTPNGHPEKSASLNDLGISFLIRFMRLGKPSDLEQAISMLEQAAHLAPNNHPHKPAFLNDLGMSLLTRSERFGEPSDLDQGFSRLAEADQLTPDHHPHKPRHLDSLGAAVFARFEQRGKLDDLEEAISLFKRAVALTPDGHPEKPGFLNNLGSAFTTRSERLGELRDLEEAISLHSRAATTSTAPISTRLRASQQWIACARAGRHQSLLDAYSLAISLYPQLAWIDLPLPRLYGELLRGVDMMREAVAAALDSERLETAVEWLEQGRSIVWGEMFQLRSSRNELSSAHPDHARRLRELSASLISQPIQSGKDRMAIPLDQEVDKHRTLVNKRDSLLQEIRSLPGFERFLLHKEFSHLRTSANSGPVVLLNAAKSRCDALIILANADHVIRVPLPNFTPGRCQGLQKKVQSLLDLSRGASVSRGGRREKQLRANWESVLSALWSDAVKPVLDALDFSTPGDLRRIFWCPTGPFTFLPIHAAGLYGTQSSKPGQKVSDFVVSSYVPTLGILTPASKPDVISSGKLRLLTVRQSSSDGLPPLPDLDTSLRAVIQNSPPAQTTFMEPSSGTVEEVLSLVKEADWVYFACHGMQNVASPAGSGLCLANQRCLNPSDIISIPRPHGGLAFLPACHTAPGDLCDVVIYIATGMLYAGYGGVVSTMWSTSDRLAPLVTKGVYEQLFRNGTKPDYREAARALQDTVGRLRDTNNATFAEWLPFIHVGL